MLRRLLPLLVIVAAQVVAGVATVAGGAGPQVCDPDRLTAMHAIIMASCPCETAVSHGQFAGCARHAIVDALARRTLPRACRRFARRIVTRSSCGRPGAVTCCRPDLPATAVCTVMHDANACRVVGGCVGATPTCFGACAAGCSSATGAFVEP